MRADAIVRVSLFTTDQGGLVNPRSGDYIPCPIMLQGELFECFIEIKDIGVVHPGQSFTAPIAFLSPHFVLPMLEIGTEFGLWADFRIFGVATVVELSK